MAFKNTLKVSFDNKTYVYHFKPCVDSIKVTLYRFGDTSSRIMLGYWDKNYGVFVGKGKSYEWSMAKSIIDIVLREKFTQLSEQLKARFDLFTIEPLGIMEVFDDKA